MRHIPDVSGASLVPFVCDVAVKGAEILTDGWGGYSQLLKCGYSHDRAVLLNGSDQPHISMPGVDRVATLLKRWLLSTHQGSFSGKHLEYYLAEHTFRFNRRTSQFRGMPFIGLWSRPCTPPHRLTDKSSNKSTTCRVLLRQVETPF